MAVKDLKKIPFEFKIKGITSQVRKSYERLQGAEDPRKIRKYGEQLKTFIDAYIEIKEQEYKNSKGVEI